MRVPLTAVLLIILVACRDTSAPEEARPQASVTLQPVSNLPQRQVETVFGPRRFEHRPGKPVPETVTITIADFEHYEQPFSLHLRNGDEFGRHRVSSAVVSLNGTPVLGQPDFSRGVSQLDVAVQLADPSSLTVTIFSSSGKDGCESGHDRTGGDLDRRDPREGGTEGCGVFVTVWVEGRLRPGHARIGPAGGVVRSADQRVTLLVPRGAVEQGGIIAIDPASSSEVPQTDSLVPGTAYFLRPDGKEFLQPLTLKIGFDTARVPEGAELSNLTLHRLVDGRWREAAFSVQTTAEVSGQIVSFSAWSIVNGGKPKDLKASCGGGPVFAGRSVECKTTPLGGSGDPLFRYVDGEAKDPKKLNYEGAEARVGTSEQTITFRALEPGTTNIHLFVGEVFVDIPITVLDPWDLGPTPVGTRIIVEHFDDLWWVDPATQEITQLTNSPTVELYAQLSPEGTELAFTSESSDGSGGLFLMAPVPGASATRLVAEPDPRCLPGRVAWAPGGRAIAYVMSCFGTRVYVVNRDGTENRLLAENASGSLAWLADGRLAWTSGGQLLLANLNTGEVVGLTGQVIGERVILDLARAGHLDPHPSAVRLLTTVPWDAGEMVVELELTTPPTVREILDSSDPSEVLRGDHPSWSPDGERFAFEGEEGLFTRSVRTTGQTQVSNLRDLRILDWGLVSGTDESRVTRTVIGSEGGVAFSWDGKFRVQVPPGAVSKPETLVIAPSDPRPVRARLSGVGFPLFVFPLTQVYSLRSTASELSVPAAVTMNIDPSLVLDLGARDVFVGRLDLDGRISFPSGNVFDPESPIGIGAAAGELTTFTTTFSDFFAAGTDLAGAVDFVRSEGRFQSVAPERFYIDFPPEHPLLGLRKRDAPVTGIVIHSFDWKRKTAADLVQTPIGAAVDHLLKVGCVRAHYFIGRTPLKTTGQPDGWLLRLFTEDVAVCHTRSGVVGGNVFTNDNSVGIELEQWIVPCEEPATGPDNTKVCLVDATSVWSDKNTIIPRSVFGDGFTDAQYSTLRNLICDLADRHPGVLSKEHIALHHEVDPDNKGDPRQFQRERIADLPENCDRIAFESHRTGLPEIFTVEAPPETEPSGWIERSLRRLTGNEARATGKDPTARNGVPEWSADRKRIVFSMGREATRSVGDKIAIMNNDGSGLRQLTYDPSYSDGDATWSPDGSFIVFNRQRLLPDGRLGEPTLWKVDVRETTLAGLGKGEEPPTDSLTEGFWPDWAPLRNVIGFLRGGDLYEINVDGTDERKVCCDRAGVGMERFDYNPTNDLTYAASVNWAEPIGSGVFVVRTDVFFMKVGEDFDPSSGNLTRELVDAVDLHPSFSPDGRRIAFASNRSGNFGIYVMNADGKGLRQVTDALWDDAFPSWQPARR